MRFYVKYTILVYALSKDEKNILLCFLEVYCLYKYPLMIRHTTHGWLSLGPHHLVQ